MTVAEEMLAGRSLSRGFCQAVRRCSQWTGRESLEEDDPEVWRLVQEEKKRSSSVRRKISDNQSKRKKISDSDSGQRRGSN